MWIRKPPVGMEPRSLVGVAKKKRREGSFSISHIYLDGNFIIFITLLYHQGATLVNKAAWGLMASKLLSLNVKIITVHFCVNTSLIPFFLKKKYKL